MRFLYMLTCKPGKYLLQKKNNHSIQASNQHVNLNLCQHFKGWNPEEKMLEYALSLRSRHVCLRPNLHKTSTKVTWILGLSSLPQLLSLVILAFCRCGLESWKVLEELSIPFLFSFLSCGCVGFSHTHKLKHERTQKYLKWMKNHRAPWVDNKGLPAQLDFICIVMIQSPYTASRLFSSSAFILSPLSPHFLRSFYFSKE